MASRYDGVVHASSGCGVLDQDREVLAEMGEELRKQFAS
jgi:hypothetical protein